MPDKEVHQKFHDQVAQLVFVHGNTPYIVPRKKEAEVTKLFKSRQRWGGWTVVPPAMPIAIPMYMHRGRQIKKAIGIK